MKTLKITALFMIILLINSTLIYGDIFDTIKDPKEKLDDTTEALSNSQETDIIINVDNYYPLVLSEQAFESDQPGGYLVSATLTGIKTNPLVDLQKIEINVRQGEGSSKYVRNVYYKKPPKGYFSLDNLGYIAIRLKKIKEDDVPKRLDINMTADIRYKVQNGFGVNEQDLSLPVLSEEEFLQRRTEFSFYGGRGYIRLADIKGDTAYLIVYDGDLTKNSFGVKQGDKPSSEKFLSGGASYLLFENPEDFIGRNSRNRYQVRVNQISGNKDTAKIEMLFNGEYMQKEFAEGQALYPGSEWKVNDIRIVENYDEVEFLNTKTREKLLLKGGNYVYAPEEISKADPPETVTPEIPSEVPGWDDVINPGNTEQVNSWIEQYSDKHNIDSNFVKGLYANEGVFKMQWNGYAQRVLDDKLSRWKNKPITLKNLLEQEKIIRDNKVYFDKQGMHYSEDKGSRYTAYGYGQFVRSTAEEKWYLLYGEKSSSSRFYPDKNIELTAYYLKLLGLKKDSSRAQKVSLLKSYTGGSPDNYGPENNKHINSILNSEKEYAAGKKFTVGGKEYAQTQSGIPAEESKIDEFLQEYKIIHSDFSILIERENIEDIEGLDSVLEDYKIFLNKANSKGDEKLFNKYRSFVLKDLTDLRSHYVSNNNVGDKIIATIASLNLQFKPNVIESEKSDEIVEGSSDYYFNKAIEYYRAVVENYNGVIYDEGENNQVNLAMQAQLKIAEIYDKNLKDNNKAIEEYTKLITQFDYPEKNIIENRIKFLEIGRGYFSNTLNIAENENSLSLTLYSVKKAGADDTVVISVDGVSKTYSLKNDDLAGTGWFLKEINEDYVEIVRYEKDKDGINKEVQPSIMLKLNKEENLRIGSDDKQPKTFLLQKLNLNQEAHITILPGEEKITTHTTFTLHIPVEPRLWKLSTEQINQQINFSRNTIDFLNKAINTIEGIYKIWNYGCYATFGYLVAKNAFWFGAKAEGMARKEIMPYYEKECRTDENKKIYNGDIIKCITDRKDRIERDVEKAKDIFDNKKIYGERIEALSKENFEIKDLNNKYDREVINVIKNKYMEERLKESRDLTLKDKQKAILYSDKEILKNKDDIKFKYGLSDDLFKEIENSLHENPNIKESLGLEKISKSSVYEDNGEKHYFAGDVHKRIFNEESKEFYIDQDENGDSKKVYIEIVPDNEIKTIPEQRAITLIDSGKWKGKIDRLSLNSIAYLGVSNRGGDGRILEVELWERNSEFGEIDLDLDTEKTGRFSGPFGLDDCRQGRTSDRKGVDELVYSRTKYPRLQEACNELAKIDGNIDLSKKKPGEIINGYSIQYAVQETGGLQCFDMMSIDDCLTLFSVCDPVMCPVSRFTTGGWKVDNVVSTGFWGSIYLGKNLWDFKRVPPEIGICIPGIDASLKNYRSLMEGYEQCLIARRDKGENVGICDTIRSIGICKIAWREGTSVIKLTGGVLDKISGNIMPQSSGGGEYGFFQSNIKQTGEFLNFFTKEYATTYFSAYRGASTDEIGEELCKAAIYGKVPGAGNFLDQLKKPEGPVQFTGWFTEIPNNDLAGQLISDYEIYYHIYAGEDRERIRYSVYLKDLDDLSRNPLYVTRTTGYLNRGDFVDETVRRQDVTGYDELCISIEGKENCGFGRISSDFLVDYFEDKNLEKQVRNKNIQTEQECTGESTVFSDPGITSFVDALYPGLANNGLVRVCSKENPGKGVDNTTWLEVGSCGVNNLNQELGKCWISKQSYKDALSVYDVKRREEAEKFFKELGVNLLSDEEVRKQIDYLTNYRNNIKEAMKLSQDKENIKEEFEYMVGEFGKLIGKTISVDLGAKINFEIGETYYELALYLNKDEIKENPSGSETTTSIEGKNNFKVVLVAGIFGIDSLVKDYAYLWDGSSWSGKFITNDYQSGLNKIKETLIKHNFYKVELYCGENDSPFDILEKDLDLNEDTKNTIDKWINQGVKECLNIYNNYQDDAQKEISKDTGNIESENIMPNLLYYINLELDDKSILSFGWFPGVDKLRIINIGWDGTNWFTFSHLYDDSTYKKVDSNNREFKIGDKSISLYNSPEDLRHSSLEELGLYCLTQRDICTKISFNCQVNENIKSSIITENFNGDIKEWISNMEAGCLNLQQNKVIIIDPGHGFIDSADGTSMRGAGYQGVYEVDIVLRIANYLKNELEAKGFSVFLTKSKNSENPTLAERAEFANHKNANFFISLHSDDFVPCPVSGGTHVLYYDISNSFFEDKDSNGKVDSLYVPRDNLNNVILNNYDLGTLMVNKLNKDLGMNKFYGAQSVRASDSGVLSRLDMPGVLIEIGFLCNDYDRKILLSKQQEIAQSIAQSTEEYYLGIS